MKKILIANRGEIACRIIRTAKKMNIETVAIYSEADKNALHVQMADEAYLVGPAPSAKSYLNQSKIIEVAKAAKVDGIHPGYGFLSENATFTNAVSDAGIVFIGPSPEAMEVMGSKLAAKAAVKQYDIPMVPGTDDAVEDFEEAIRIAKEIGFPILIKASAGGGGKGMRVVENEANLKENMQRAISEAESSFGDGSVFIEKYIGSPRHIEIQILADTHGNVLHLFERECSIQRRHQKVIEEAPSCVLTPEIRAAMGDAAIRVAKACDYVGAGTVEFLLDENKNFYFLEMNTRLQVEHPVTEMITGLDLVEQQIKVARGETLAFSQSDLSIHGHSIELRVYAEDPKENFSPSIGTLSKYDEPSQDFSRADSGYIQGMEIPIHYDPMIAKLVVWAENRDEARLRMKQAIKAYQIEGIETTLDFGTFVMDHPAFAKGDFDTHFVKHHFDPNSSLNPKHEEAAALFASWFFEKEKEKLKPITHLENEWNKQ
ncbi:MAG: acetyl-CoA carboxylase biotin carboxylase subunit [Bacteroidota bacterium]